MQPTGSIGAIAVAPSDPNIIYVGSGEGLHRPDLSVGNGIYKSTDAGTTWTHLGLRDGQQISMMAVDPRDPNRLFVAVAGHPYGPNRGARASIVRPTAARPSRRCCTRTRTSAATMSRSTPPTPIPCMPHCGRHEKDHGKTAIWNGTGGGIYKSTDGGQTWKQLAGGLPADIVQAYITIAPSNPKRLFASSGYEGYG